MLQIQLIIQLMGDSHLIKSPRYVRLISKSLGLSLLLALINLAKEAEKGDVSRGRSFLMMAFNKKVEESIELFPSNMCIDQAAT